MDNYRIAVLSDIHGNRWALEAVLADLKKRDVRKMVNLGDSLFGPLDPAGTAEILMGLDMPSVMGNEDRIIFETSTDAGPSPTLRYVRNSITGRMREWLKAMPMTMVVSETFFLCHGSPSDDTRYLLVEVKKEGALLSDRETLIQKTAGIAQPVVLCGHDHMPRAVFLSGGKFILNPGSVGLPAYTDSEPYHHRMETGSPHARYAVVSRTENGWLAEDIAVPYAWDIAASVARENGRPDWARWLTSGRADW